MQLIRHRWRRQPQIHVRVNSTHLSARGLIVAVPTFGPVAPNNQIEIANRGFPVAFNSAGSDASKWNDNVIAQASQLGPVSGGHGDSIGVGYSFPDISARLTATGEVTALFVCRSIAQDPTGDHAPFNLKTGSNAQHYPYIDGNIYIGPFYSNRWVNGVAPIADITTTHVAIVTCKAGEQKFYIRGLLGATGSEGGAPTIDVSTILKHQLGGQYGEIDALLVWDRVLTYGEIAALSVNPWQVFEPLPGRMWLYAPSTGGGVSISATESSDSAALTGAMPTGAAISVGDANRNLLTFTEQFDNAAWTKTAATITADATTAPDGTTTADKLIGTGGAGTHKVTQNVTLAPSTTYTKSVHGKPAELTAVNFNVDDLAGTSHIATFRADLGTVTFVTGGDTAGVVDVGNGWYRFWMTFDSATGAGAPNEYISGAVTGDGTSGVYFWGAQTEVGALSPYQAVPAVNYSDTAAIAADTSATVSGTIAATESADTAAVATTVTTGAGIAATETADSAALIAANWVTAQLAALESSDNAALATSATTGATIGATESPDGASLIAANWTTAAVAASESPDNASIAAADWMTAQIAALEAADNSAIATTVTTGAAIGALESADSTTIIADANLGVTEAVIVATETSDNTSIVGLSSILASLGVTDAADIAAITARVTAGAFIVATESSDGTALTAATGSTVSGGLACVESPDAASIATAAPTRAAGGPERIGLAVAVHGPDRIGLGVAASSGGGIGLAVIKPRPARIG